MHLHRFYLIILGELMDVYQQDFLLEVQEEDEDDSFNFDYNVETNEEVIDNTMQEEIEFELGSILIVLKCSVHTLQLAVHDTMKH